MITPNLTYKITINLTITEETKEKIVKFYIWIIIVGQVYQKCDGNLYEASNEAHLSLYK